jgi:hypothetical protein
MAPQQPDFRVFLNEFVNAFLTLKDSDESKGIRYDTLSSILPKLPNDDLLNETYHFFDINRNGYLDLMEFRFLLNQNLYQEVINLYFNIAGNHMRIKKGMLVNSFPWLNQKDFDNVLSSDKISLGGFLTFISENFLSCIESYRYDSVLAVFESRLLKEGICRSFHSKINSDGTKYMNYTKDLGSLSTLIPNAEKPNCNISYAEKVYETFKKDIHTRKIADEK